MTMSCQPNCVLLLAYAACTLQRLTTKPRTVAPHMMLHSPNILLSTAGQSSDCLPELPAAAAAAAAVSALEPMITCTCQYQGVGK